MLFGLKKNLSPLARFFDRILHPIQYKNFETRLKAVTEWGRTLPDSDVSRCVFAKIFTQSQGNAATTPVQGTGSTPAGGLQPKDWNEVARQRLGTVFVSTSTLPKKMIAEDHINAILYQALINEGKRKDV